MQLNAGLVRCALTALLLLTGLAPAQSPRKTIETYLAPASASDAGPLASAQRLTVTLTFAPSAAQSVALAQFLADLTTASSPNYRHWLTPAEYAAAYGATQAQITAATAWAQSQGLSVDAISPAGTRITFSGDTAQIESAFDVSLHAYKLGGALRYAPTTAPSLPVDLFSSIDGLDDLPGPMTLAAEPTVFAALGRIVDANTTPLLNLSSTLCTPDLNSAEIAGYTTLFEQAAAQGMTILATTTCSSGAFPGALAEVTALASADPDTASPIIARPSWQVAPGLPGDTLRHTPDLTASSASAFAQTLTGIAASVPSARLGDINPILYQLAPTPGLYSQSGEWQAATGLGLVDLDKLAKVFPRGTASSFVSLSISPSYAPTYGTAVTFSSAVTSGAGGAIPTGTVSYVTSTGAVLAGPVTVDASGNATVTTSAIPGGAYKLTATYSGDGTYAAATSTPATSFTVEPENANLTGSVSTGNIIGGSYTATITATAANSIGQPGGTATLSISGTATSYTLPLSPLGAGTAAAVFTEPATTVGTLTLAANCTGNANFTCPNPFTGNVTIAKATPGMSVGYSPAALTPGDTITLTSTLTPYGAAPTPTGTVTFYDGATGLNSAKLDAGGVATVTGVVPNTATHSITGIYNGDANYNTLTVAAGSPTMVASASVTTLTASTYTAAVGAPVTLMAVVQSANASSTSTPTGSVVFSTTAGVVLATVQLTAGSASYTIAPALAAGSYTFTASYSGDTTYLSSTGIAPSPVVVGSSSASLIATSTALSLSPLAPVAGQRVVFTATVTPASTGASAPSGTVNFYNGTTLLGSGAVALGTATATITLASTASASLTAVYSGDTLYATSTSPAITLAAALTPTTIVISSSTSTGFAGSDVVLTATVTGAIPSTNAPSGTVSFYISGATPRLLGSGQLAASGATTAVATLDSSSIPTGSQTVYAIYSGDTIFLPSTSSTIAIGLSDYSLTFSPANISLAAGATGTTTIDVVNTGNFTAPVLITCIPPANTQITCTLGSTSVTAGGSTTLTISTNANTSRGDARVFGVAGSRAITAIAVALLFCVLPPIRRRRLPAMLLVLFLIALSGISGCATTGSRTSISGSGTPAGTFSVTIDTTAALGPTSVAHDYTFQVSVQ